MPPVPKGTPTYYGRMDDIRSDTQEKIKSLHATNNFRRPKTSSMFDLAVLLKKGDEQLINSGTELISYVDDINEETGEITTVKVVF